MKVVTFLNEKGGVGKTTLAVGVAAGLANLGLRVLLIDADAQGHSTIMLGQRKRGALYDLLAREEPWRSCTVGISPEIWADSSKPYPESGQLMLVASNVETQVIPNVTDNSVALVERLEEVRDVFDYVVIDTSPTPSQLHAMLYYATDGVIMPSQCEGLSLDGLAHTTKHWNRVNNNRKEMGMKSARLLGVIPTMYDVRTNAHEWGLNEIRQHFGEALTWPPMGRRTIWNDVSAKRVTIYNHAPRDVAAAEMWEIVNMVQGAMAYV